MNRILALDVGEKKVGIAVSDGLNITAQPLCVLKRKPHKEFMNNLANIIQQYEVKLILLGLPRRTSGEKGPEVQKVLSLGYQLKENFNLPIETWDEWFSTKEAERLLISANVKRKDRAMVIDKTAAAIILDGYLNFIKNNE